MCDVRDASPEHLIAAVIIGLDGIEYAIKIFE